MPTEIDIKDVTVKSKELAKKYKTSESCVLVELALEKYLEEQGILFEPYLNEGRHGFIVAHKDGPKKIVSCSVPEYGQMLMINASHFDTRWDYYVAMKPRGNNVELLGYIQVDAAFFNYKPQGFKDGKPTYYIPLMNLRPFEMFILDCRFKETSNAGSKEV